MFDQNVNESACSPSPFVPGEVCEYFARIKREDNSVGPPFDCRYGLLQPLLVVLHVYLR
jgi:hypothetical protein